MTAAGWRSQPAVFSGPLVWSGDAGILSELIDVAVRGAEVDPGVAAVVDPGLEEDLQAGGAQLGGRGFDVVDQEPATGPVVKWRLIGLSGPKTSTLLPSGSLSIQNPGRSSSRGRPRTSRKKATVGAVLSVRVPTQASLMIRIPRPVPQVGLGKRRLASRSLAAWLARRSDNRHSLAGM
jgi:hypothetical protein